MLKDYRRAIVHLEDLLEALGANPNTLHMLALCHHRLGATAEARRRALEALEHEAIHFDALVLLTDLELLVDHRDEARRFAARALACAPAPDPGPLGLKGLCRALLAPPGRGRSDAELREWLAWAREFVDEEVGGVKS